MSTKNCLVPLGSTCLQKRRCDERGTLSPATKEKEQFIKVLIYIRTRVSFSMLKSINANGVRNQEMGEQGMQLMLLLV